MCFDRSGDIAWYKYQLGVGLVVFSLCPKMCNPKIEFRVGRVDGNFARDLNPTTDSYQDVLQLTEEYYGANKKLKKKEMRLILFVG